MAIAHLITQKVQEVHFSNKLTEQGQIQLDSSFTFNVNFAKDGKRCIAHIYQSVKDKEDGEKLFASVDVIGAFSCDGIEGDEDKKQVHAQCYDQLFPYMQSTIQNLMQASGIPGFQLRKAVINPENVRVGTNPPAPAQEEPPKPQFPIV
jgi:preprotein translocase subunit SecB